MIKNNYDVIVIGGGFFGCNIASFSKKLSNNVLIIEKESELLTRASFNNQARVHNGYHYPRSFITAKRSHANFSRFIEEYNFSIYDSYQSIYAISQNNSSVSSSQFVNFCKRVGIPVKVAPPQLKKLFSSNSIEEVFQTKETVFDAEKIRKFLQNKIKKDSIDLLLSSQVIKVSPKDNKLQVELNSGEIITATKIFICAYSGINMLLKNSRLPLLPLKHELTEMCLVEVPSELKEVGITVMDGPFFSLMPFPSLNLHTLSHVRYTPLKFWTDKSAYQDGYKEIQHYSNQTNFLFMKKDAARFVPIIDHCKHKGSLFEVKTVLTDNEANDARPILLAQNYGFKNLSVIMGGKIDNIYDVVEELNRT